MEDLLLDVRAGFPRVGPEEGADSERRGASFPCLGSEESSALGRLGWGQSGHYLLCSGQPSGKSLLRSELLMGSLS